MSDLFPAPATDGGPQRWLIALNAPAHVWCGQGYSKDAEGRTRYVWHASDRAPWPTMEAIAGGDDNTVLLREACWRVARAALIADPATRQDWRIVAGWLDDGIPLPVICDAISQQVRRMGEKYTGCPTLRLFNASVVNAGAREKARP